MKKLLSSKGGLNRGRKFEELATECPAKNSGTGGPKEGKHHFQAALLRL